MRLTLISVGKNAEPFVREACADYAARIRRYADLDLTVVPEERIAAPGKIEFILRQEGRRIREKIPAAALRVVLDERGKSFTSEGFSGLFGKMDGHGGPRRGFYPGRGLWAGGTAEEGSGFSSSPFRP